MAHDLALPFDVVEHIVLHVSRSRGHMRALSLASRDLYAVANARLYRTVVIRQSRRITSFLQAVTSNPNLALLVRSVSLDDILDRVSLAQIIPALKAMSGLQHLHVQDLDSVIRRDVSVLDVLQRLGRLHLRSLRIDGRLSSAIERVFDRLPAMTRIEVFGLGSVVRSLDLLLVRSAPTLTVLSSSVGYQPDRIYEITPAGFTFPVLIDVALFSLPSRKASAMFPGVERLRLTSADMSTVAHLFDDPAIFPSLKQLQISLHHESYPEIDRSFIRELDHLHISLRSLVNLRYLSKHIQVRSLKSFTMTWPRLSDEDLPILTEHVLPFLAECVQLRYLGLGLRLYDRSGAQNLITSALESLGSVEDSNGLTYLSISLEGAAMPSTFGDDFVPTLFVRFQRLKVVQISIINLSRAWRRGSPPIGLDDAEGLEGCYVVLLQDDRALPDDLSEIADLVDGDSIAQNRVT